MFNANSFIYDGDRIRWLLPVNYFEYAVIKPGKAPWNLNFDDIYNYFEVSFSIDEYAITIDIWMKSAFTF